MDTGSNFEPKAWHGLLKTVAVEPAPIFALEGCGEVRLYFDPKKFNVNVDAVKDTLNGLVYNNNCSGFDTNRLINGDIRVYLNPACHGPSDSHRVITKVAEALCKSDLFLGED